MAPAVLEFGPDGCFGTDVRDDARADAFIARHRLMAVEYVAALDRIDAGPDLARANVKRAMVFVNARSAEMMEEIGSIAS